jgi:ribosomal 50S subunit-recycling heat shock protein
MRVDKFLQVSGIIPRRSQAQEACVRGCVHVDDRQAKPSTGVEVGSRLVVEIGRRRSVYEVVSLPARPVPKSSRREAARLVRSESIEDDA